MAMAYNPRNSRQRGNHVIQVRQAKEEARRQIIKQTEYYAKTKIKSEFENNTDAVLLRNAVRRRFEQLREREDEKIDERRSRLADLFEQDTQNWRQGLLSMEETKEQKLEQMRARASELKARREREREAIVEEKLYQRWRNECDELRTLESKSLEREVAENRLEQMHEKQLVKLAEEEENRRWDAVWEAERQKKVQREEFERGQRQAVDAATNAVLEEQIRMLREQAENEERLKQEEARLMKEEMETRRLQEERARARRLQEQRQTRQELDYFNKLRIQQRAKEVQESLEMDMRIVSEFEAMDENERSDKNKRKEELRRETQAYRQHLLEQREIERQRSKEIDEMYMREQDKLWKNRALRWQSEQAARDRLMEEVIEGRKEQLQRKLELNRIETLHNQEEKHKLIRSIEEAKRREAERRHALHEAQREYKEDLESQIHSIEQRNIRAKEKELHEAQLEKEAERRYQLFLEQEIAKATSKIRTANLNLDVNDNAPTNHAGNVFAHSRINRGRLVRG